MSYLKFEKALMTNLQDSLPRELLRTNRSGAYSCSTIVDCNTRKYHGLLVVPVPELDDENHVLLSSLDPTVIQHGASFNLGLHKYQGNNFSPQGHKYIREFDCDTVPTTLYRVGGVLLKKEVGCIHYENKKNERCRRYFLNCVNIGMVANIMSLRRRLRHLFISRTISFILSCFLLMFQRMDYFMSLKINVDSIKQRLMTVCVGNAQGYGQTPNAVPYNGLLDVSIVSQPKLWQAMEGMYLLLRDKILNHRNVMPYRTQELSGQIAEHTPVSVDGRRLNGTPVGTFTIGVEKEVINFLIPD